MFARINVPGSSHHKFFYGTKKECLAWIAEQEENADYQQDYFPNSLLTDKEAFACKYRDGNRVYYFKPHYHSSWQPKCHETGNELF